MAERGRPIKKRFRLSCFTEWYSTRNRSLWVEASVRQWDARRRVEIVHRNGPGEKKDRGGASRRAGVNHGQCEPCIVT